ncbi:G-protein beta WD-40 repeats containing protein [Reticulomyxa filosa]|uniref:G-protein beta WD-40 repeats containing protein n=1 Tax=Reticulomyxa filosa TaxID=46433 RepID=X6LZJ3_RETFI|nr:G-protein beta WD-40 repeats containing protein [Reticulomyxa filosa]|eukprot:ETO07029.1 G-protein beta WD-40 repeats containing protein [Reticulomyxa filosa]
MTAKDMKLEESSKLDIVTPPFEKLCSLPTAFQRAECVAIGDYELVICGGFANRQCYSYHMAKDQYRPICDYPMSVKLHGHCVVKLVSNESTDAITLLSFGGSSNEKKHTLIMKYKSVWRDGIGIEDENKEQWNIWTQLTDSNKTPIHIGSHKDDYCGVRAVIDGSRKHLLFITYHPNNIAVFDLNTFQCIKHGFLSIANFAHCHCFASKKNVNEMILFCQTGGLSIAYDEHTNMFQFDQLRVCTNMRPFRSYGYACVDDVVLFFGGSEMSEINASKEIYKYSIIEKQWTKFEQTLPNELTHCTAIVDDNHTCIHIIGGFDGRQQVPTHMKTNVREWTKEETERERQWKIEEEMRIQIEQIKTGLERMGEALDIKKLKVIIFYVGKVLAIFFNTVVLDIKMIIRHWFHSSLIAMDWVDDLDIIISQYIMVCRFISFLCYFIFGKMKYFKPSETKIKGHSDCVNNVKFSSDGNTIVSCSHDKTIKIWDLTNGKEIKKLKGHSHWVNDARFSLDGNMIVSCSNDETIRLWDIHSSMTIATLLGHLEQVRAVQCLFNKNMIVSCSYDQTIQIWDILLQQSLMVIKAHSKGINDIQLSPNGQLLISASNDKTIGIWDIQSGGLIKMLKGHEKTVNRVKFSPNGLLIASCSSDTTIRIWDAMSGTQMNKLTGHSGSIYDIQFFPDGQTVVSCSLDNTIRLWDVTLGTDIQILKGNFGCCITAIDFSGKPNEKCPAFRPITKYYPIFKLYLFHSYIIYIKLNLRNFYFIDKRLATKRMPFTKKKKKI